LDLSVLQPVSWVAAAIGVCIAAFYYVVNLRETTRNRRANLTQSMLHEFSSIEGFKNILQLYEMKWDSFNDYMAKYDSTVNHENAAIRHNVWDNLDIIGYWWREGIVDKHTIYTVCGGHCTSLWVKFKPIIEEYRRVELNSKVYSNWEYLANEMQKMTLAYDPSWKDKQIKTITSYEK
jgi:hypothetical protein